MIVLGALLLVAGLVSYVAGVGDLPGNWWMLSTALVAAGLGAFVAGTVALGRRRLAPIRTARRAVRSETTRGGPLRRIKAIPSMISASWRGQNPALPRYQTVLWGVAVIYLISPIDAIPELLPLLGISDDIGVGAWLLTSLYAESGNYLGQVGQEQEPEEG